MRLQFSPAIFMVAFCCIYACVFALDQPLFRYYPLHGNFSWGSQTLKGIGPAMAWYGFLADAGIGAPLLALVIPQRLADGAFRNSLWVFPCAAMIVCVFLLRRLFI